MKCTGWCSLSFVAALCLALGAAESARAGILLTMTEVGSDIVLSGGGTANLAGLTRISNPAPSSGGINPVLGVALAGPASILSTDTYSGLTGPSTFGSSAGFVLASSGIGDRFGVTLQTAGRTIALPAGYVSGSPLSGTTKLLNRSFAGLGIIPGTYVWTWGDAEVDDSFTLRIERASAVPEPSTLVAALAGVALGLGSALRNARARS